MKKFTKIMLSVAAVTAVSTAMAISAMAADISATYDVATGKVTLENVASSGDQQTLLVLSEDAETVTEGIIKQIDQATAISEFVLPAGIESATYYVRIGGTDGTIQKYTLVIGSEPTPSTHEVLIGDSNQDGEVTAADATVILVAVADEEELEGDSKIAAQYCSGEDTDVTAADASAILVYVADEDHERVNTKVTVND